MFPHPAALCSTCGKTYGQHYAWDCDYGDARRNPPRKWTAAEDSLKALQERHDAALTLIAEQQREIARLKTLDKLHWLQRIGDWLNACREVRGLDRATLDTLATNVQELHDEAKKAQVLQEQPEVEDNDGPYPYY